jgi:hypothetical protein
MNNDKEYFLNLAYTYYPQGISDEDAGYELTAEAQRLKSSLRQREYLDLKWQKLLAAFQERFECLDIGVPDRTVRGFRIAIVLTEPNYHWIVVNVSKLEPFYCFYTLSGRENVKFSQPGFFLFKDFTPFDQHIVDWLKEQIHLIFQGYSELPPGLPLVVVEDVEFEEKGILKSEKYRHFFQPFTLFNAFFSTCMFC